MATSKLHGGAAEIFDPLRPRLIRVAYRMLGSVADAEDMVQEAFIRWMNADRSDVREPEAFLRRTVTRLCLDRLKSGQKQRETYFGPWIPDPVVEEEAEEDVTLPLMLALERLSPLERAPSYCTTCSGSISRKSLRPSSAMPLPAASLPPAPAGMCARNAPLSGRQAARAGTGGSILHRLAQWRHEGARLHAGGGCAYAGRWRRQTSGIRAAGAGFRRCDVDARKAGRLFRRPKL